MSIQIIDLTNDQITEISNYINVNRAKHQSPPLTWDLTIANASQQWSNYMVQNNIFQHSSNTSKYGENLAYLQGYGNDIMTLLKKAVDNWYLEVKLYDYNNPVFSSSTGHFTCLVWKSSTKYGLGITLDTKKNIADIVMNTFPPGNYVGQFRENVLPPIGTVVPLPAPIPIPPNALQAKKRIIVDSLYKIISAVQNNQSKTNIIKSINDLISFVSKL